MSVKDLLFGAIGLLVLDAVLLFTLNPWLMLLVFGQFSLAFFMTIVGVVRLSMRKGPTIIQLVVWLCLFAGIPFGILRERVLCHRIETIGTAQLLQDARALAAELHIADEPREETLDGENLLVPKSMRALNPFSVKVRKDAVLLTTSINLGSQETLVLMTDPTSTPGPLNPSQTSRSWRKGGDVYSERWLAPGIRLDFWRS